MIELSPELRDTLGDLARSAAPQECCGVIGLKNGELRVYPAENGADDPLHNFLILARDQVAIVGEILERGEELIAIYHSHPNTGPEPSDRDRMMAVHWPGVVWVIIGLRGGPIPDFWAGHP